MIEKHFHADFADRSRVARIPPTLGVDFAAKWHSKFGSSDGRMKSPDLLSRSNTFTPIDRTAGLDGSDSLSTALARVIHFLLCDDDDDGGVYFSTKYRLFPVSSIYGHFFIMAACRDTCHFTDEPPVDVGLGKGKRKQTHNPPMADANACRRRLKVAGFFADEPAPLPPTTL